MPKTRSQILSYRWHCGYQYELYKLPHDFTLVRGLTAVTRTWDYGIRPLRPNARMVELEAVDPNDFDLAILHFDQHSLCPEDSHGILPKDWGELFKYLRTTLRIPLVAVCHGVPPLCKEFFGRDDRVPEWPAPTPEVNEKERQRLVDFLGDILVVCNSHQAAKEWRFKNSTVIWHGFDPAEYPSATYQRPVLTVARGVRRRPYYRGYALYNEVTRGLCCDILGDDMPNSLSVPEPPYDDARPNEYAYKKFRNYVDLIRHYSIFFNPTLRSCMPRSRAEAMLCGLAVVTANNHDVDRFLRNGVDGFYSCDAAELRHYLEYCVKHPRAARRVGQAGSETAVRTFHYQRFLDTWQAIIKEAVG